MRPKYLLPTIAALIKGRNPFLLTGAPGVGKTEMIKQAAEIAGCDTMILHPVVDDPTDYKGLPGFVEGVAQFMPFGNLKKMMEADSPLLVFLDDLGQADVLVMAAAMQLILERSINGKRISDHVTFAAATNKREHGAGVSRMIEPLKSRFVTIIDVEVNSHDWVEWAIPNGIDPMIVSFIEFRPDFINKFEPSIDMTNSPSPRTIKHVDDLLRMDIPQAALLEVISGAAGQGFAQEFMAFRRLKDELPDIRMVFRNPEGVKVPEKPDVKYAFIGALVGHLDAEKVNAFSIVVKKFPPEFQTVAWRMAQSKVEGLYNTDQWMEYLKNNIGYLTV